MVGEINDFHASIAMNFDATSDCCDFSARIDKKRSYQPYGDVPLPLLAQPLEIMIRLSNSLRHCGGGAEIEPSVLHTVSVPFDLNVHTREMQIRDARRQQIMLAASNSSIALSKEIDNAETRQEMGTTKVESKNVFSITPQKLQGEVEMRDVLASHGEVSLDMRPPFVNSKLIDHLPSKQNKTPTLHKNVSATLQQLKTQISNKHSDVNQYAALQMLEVDYTFQNWTGDHSVKVSLPAQFLREGTFTLQPSDIRAAEALSRNLGQLPGLTPELLLMEHEQHEQHEQQRGRHQEEEEEE